MLYKTTTIPAVDEHGYRRVIPLMLEKTASASSLPDGVENLHKDTLAFIKKIKSHPDKSYVVVIAIGKGETWGPNRKGDLVPEDHLIPDFDSTEFKKRPYGYVTFRQGHFFAHHRNKPHKGHPVFGGVPFVGYNPDMEWVELVVEVDRPALGAKFPELLQQIDYGVFDVSMGLFAAADVCSICGNTRRLPGDKLCKHNIPMSRGGLLGKIYEDGRVACMINLFPRFHDISIVNIGADTIGKGLAKVAALDTPDIRRAVKKLKKEQLIKKMGTIPEKPSLPLGIEKFSILKLLAQRLANKERDISQSFLLKESSESGLSLLRSLMGAGVILKPHEFQTVVLGATDPGRARKLSTGRVTFVIQAPKKTVGNLGLSVGDLPSTVRILVGKHIAPSRSWFPGPLMERLTDMCSHTSPVLESPLSWNQCVIPDLAGMYARYIKFMESVLEKNASIPIETLTGMASDPLMRLEKRASAMDTVATALMLLPAAYMTLMMTKKISQGSTFDLDDPKLSKKDRALLENPAMEATKMAYLARLLHG